MCGIAGYISTFNTIDGSKMIQTLSHRGPDHIGEYRDILNNFNIFLAHSRLSIIDLSSRGNQPMFSPDKNIVIIFNGEVYNFQKLKQQYLKEYNFRSRTDTEVILYLYDKLGIEFVKELEGDFAIAIYDKKRFKIYLIRDRIGVKPLYYAFVNKTLLFASEIKSILSSGYSFTLSKTNIQNFFVFKYVPGNNTLYREILRVRPGHYLEYDIKDNRISEREYWKLEKRKEYENLSYHESMELLCDLLEGSVKNHLISDVPVGTFFSGGLDSSIIAYYLKDYSQIKHYCAKKSKIDIKKEGTSDDYNYAKRLADFWKLEFYPIEINSEILTLDQLRKVIYYSDDLIADGSQIASYLITKESSSTSKVMLSGMGGDELFFGYASYLMTLLSIYMEKLPFFIENSIKNSFSLLSQGRGLFKSYRRYLHKLGKYHSYPYYKHGIYGIVGDFENSLSVYNNNNSNAIEHLRAYFSEDSDLFESKNRFSIDNFLVKNLHYIDRMCMANSVEGRFPYLDYRIVEFAFSLKRNYKLSNFGKFKKILKDAYRSKLPPSIINRKKAGFGLPLRSIFSSKNKIDQLIDKDFFNNFCEFSLENIDRIVKNHLVGIEDNSSIIYALVSFQEWYKMFTDYKAGNNDTAYSKL